MGATLGSSARLDLGLQGIDFMVRVKPITKCVKKRQMGKVRMTAYGCGCKESPRRVTYDGSQRVIQSGGPNDLSELIECQ